MAIKYKGEVPFKDSTGEAFVLRLGTFQWMKNQDSLNALLREGKARDYQCQLFHVALVNGQESQKELTLEDAVELIDDLGYTEANKLLEQTKFGRNVHDAAEVEKSERVAATARAAVALKSKLEAMRSTAVVAEAKAVIDDLDKFIDRMQPKEGSANPPESTT